MIMRRSRRRIKRIRRIRIRIGIIRIIVLLDSPNEKAGSQK